MDAIDATGLSMRLRTFADLDDADCALASGLLSDPVAYPQGAVILQQGQPVAGPRLLSSGWACRVRSLPSGKQQVFALVLPGDFIGLCWRPRPRALSSTIAITPVTLHNASSLTPVMTGRGAVHPDVWEALTLVSRHDEMRLLDQVVRLGQQTALERLVSLLLETHARLKQVNLATRDEMPFPLTQEHLSAVLGISLVHVNRTLQSLRKEGLADIHSGRAFLRDMARLRVLTHYEATARPYAEAI